ncbi:Two-component sensor kinase SA14-24 [Streptococcus mitis]|uniref:Two-component sensor kinase SA14-24 n=1 Tax=Streptococcus mitis TaxID=28037 RepID=A0A150NMH9_STRMT|nr:Two-component sensor kinase SA14-24 [Streptococcus mitis]
MIELIRKNILTSDFIFILILLGFILIVTLLLLENRRDNIRLKQINQKS